MDMSNSRGSEANEDPSLRYPFSSDFRYYTTILYGEAKYAIDFSQKGHVSGIPIIFVPGNAGSARQARSLGSVLQNKTESRNTSFHFDTFAVDFNEELSGIAGMYIERQVRYLNFVVDHIWKMYDPAPNGLILVGHSMGGIVIRSLLRDPNFDVSRIALMITLGTPHRSPPVIFDSFMEKAYHKMHDAWLKRGTGVPVISLSGGLKDSLVPEHLSTEHGLYHFSITAIDGVEAEADHLCIVWCNQLVRHISRLLFEYAEYPEAFSKKLPSIVDRLYASNGNFYVKSADVEYRKFPLFIKQELTVVKNTKNVSRKAPLKASGDDAVFLLLSRGSSFLFSHGIQYGVHSSKKFQYVFLPSTELPNEFDLLLESQRGIKAIAFSQENLKKQTLHLGGFSLIKGFFSHLWKTVRSGKALAVVVPADIRYVWIAFRAELKQTGCNGKKRGISRIEFSSRGMRRLSNDFGNSEAVVGYNLHSNETAARFLFILDTACEYELLISLDFRSTLTLLLQRHADILAFCAGVYSLSALFVTALSVKGSFKADGSRCEEVRIPSGLVTGFLYAAVVFGTKKTDTLFILLSAVTLCFLLHLLLIVIDIITFLASKLTVRFTPTRNSKALGTVLVISGICFSYLYNGFVAITIFFFMNFMDNCKRVAFGTEMAEKRLMTMFSQLHILAFLLFVPHGICSVWNLYRYGTMTAYEDPIRSGAYLLGTVLLLRIFAVHKIPGLVYVLGISLLPFVFLQTEIFLCLNRLGTYLGFVATVFPMFVLPQFSKRESENLKLKAS